MYKHTIQGIMTGLRGYCSSSIQGSRANDAVKTRAYDVIIRPAPEGAGRTIPPQPGHYSHYNTKLTNSRYFHRNSYRIALIESPSRSSCSWKSSEHFHPTLLDLMHVPPSLQSVCWFVFDPKWAAVNDLNSVCSSTTLCGTPVGTPNPLREAKTSQWSNLRALLSLTLLSTHFIVPNMS